MLNLLIYYYSPFLLKVIKNHIEDLVNVNRMVHGSEDPDPDGYIRVLHSDKSHLRIDY